MRRFWTAYAVLMVAGACKIEPTPQHYIDRQPAIAEQAASSQAELSERLRELPIALAVRDTAEIEELLLPHPDGVFLSTVSAGGAIGQGVAAAIDDVVAGRTLETTRVEVTVGPQNTAAWFAAEYQPESLAGESGRVILSGVFRRLEGRWRLVQAHLSGLGEHPDANLYSGDVQPEAPLDAQ